MSSMIRLIVGVAVLLTGIFDAFGADNHDIIRKIESRAIETGSDYVALSENGRLIYSNHFGHAEKLQSVQSITKSVCGLAIGILLDRGAIESVDRPMSDWISEWASHPEKSKITLKMIMSQTSGLPNDSAIAKAQDRIEFAVRAPLAARPGDKFIYSGVGSALLQLVIAKSSGLSVEEFVAKNLFGPLGIREWKWSKDQAGHEATGGGLYLRPSDLTKIGQLVLGDGVFEGRKIISAPSLDLLLTKSQRFEDYGLLWWLKLPMSSDRFRIRIASGWAGQYIIVFPEKNLVAVRTVNPSSLSDEEAWKKNFGDFGDLVASWR